MRACIITNSPQVSATAIEQQSARADLVIVTDGAAHLLPEGVRTHVICGDFDSIDRGAAEKRFSSAEFIHQDAHSIKDIMKAQGIPDFQAPPPIPKFIDTLEAIDDLPSYDSFEPAPDDF